MGTEIISIVVVLVIIIVSMVLHELAHGVVAYWLGDETAKIEGRLTLNPIKHLDPVMSVAVPLMLFLMGGPVFGGAKPVPIDSRRLKFNEWGMALVALAGPMMNFLLAFVMFMILHLTGLLYTWEWSAQIGVQFVMINLGFMLFNLLPIPPLDGSRVLYAIAPDGARRVMATMEMFGVWMVFGLVMILGGALSQYMSGAMSGILDGFMWLVRH